MSDVPIWEHQLFTGLSESQRVWLSNRVELKEHPPKSKLYSPNDPSDLMYLLLQGKVKTETFGNKKNWLIREILCPNEFFGLHGLLGQTAREEYALTLRSKTLVATFNNSDLKRLMEVDFGFAEKIIQIAAQKTIQFEQRSTDHVVMTALARFAHFLIERLGKEGQPDGDGWFYNSEITHEEIGAYIGTGRQTVTEILAELKGKNILEYNWGKFWVMDLEGLKEFV